MPAAVERRWLLGFDTDELTAHECEVLVVGSGIAGLTAALRLAGSRQVALVTKARLTDTNTWLAQGGIAGAVGEADSVELHLADTLVVGQGLCDEAVVRAVVAEAPEALAELQSVGMRFDTEVGGEVALAREGGHSLPRVLHSGDATGAAVQSALTVALRANERVSVFEHHLLVDLLVEDGTCRGAIIFDSDRKALEVIWAGAVILATGGAGQVFGVTTNPLVATGDGVAAAWRAGAEITDMEFVQFHPTALDHAAAPRFLVSEALRGEGAHLLDCDLQRFMVGVHPLEELAPRDVVSREIERVMARCGRDNVWLDARHLGEPYLKTRFPTIWQACADAGYDLAHDLVPVAPAAHYLIGGVRVDLDGESNIERLYASGEVAATGLHGANRLASNSLLEGLVFSRRITRALERADLAPARGHFRSGATEPTTMSARPASATVVRGRIQQASGRLLGMSRTADGLAEDLALSVSALESLSMESSAEAIESANLACVSALIAAAASLREETRGCHSRLDHPERDDESWSGHTVFVKGEAPAFVPVSPPADR